MGSRGEHCLVSLAGREGLSGNLGTESTSPRSSGRASGLWPQSLEQGQLWGWAFAEVSRDSRQRVGVTVTGG